MKTIHSERLMQKTREYWDAGNHSISLAFNHIIKGEILFVNSKEVENSHMLFLIVIRNPKFEISDHQLSLIADYGSASVSQGSITYEGPFAYIVWSNLGHHQNKTI